VTYYHVRITRLSNRSSDCLELDLSEKNLIANIVDPYKAGTKFLCGGTIIDPFDIDTLQINETPYPSSKYLPEIRARNAASKVVAMIPDEWEVTEEGEVVTRKYISGPPGAGPTHETADGKHAKPAIPIPIPVPTQPDSRKGNYVFISHSSKDTDLVSAIKHAFVDLSIEPRFLEERPAGAPPTKELAEAVKNSKAIFVFFTWNSITLETRDWIIFELGVAVAYRIPIYCWKQKSLSNAQLPRLLEQVTTYREFEISSSQSTIKLTEEVRTAAKALVSNDN